LLHVRLAEGDFSFVQARIDLPLRKNGSGRHPRLHQPVTLRSLHEQLLRRIREFRVTPDREGHGDNSEARKPEKQSWEFLRKMRNRIFNAEGAENQSEDAEH